MMGGLCHARPSVSVECWFPMGSKRWTTLPSLRIRRLLSVRVAGWQRGEVGRDVECISIDDSGYTPEV